MPNGHHSELDALRSEDYAREIAAKDAEIARLEVHWLNANAEIVRLQDTVFRLEAHLKAVRSEIEQSWQRVQVALSRDKRDVT